MAGAEVIRIVLADDHALFRAGLRLLIETQPDMKVVGEAADGHEALARCTELRPDIALLDLSMPGPRTQLVKAVVGACPTTRVIVLTMHDDAAYLHAALTLGAAGYVLKRCADTDLLSAIRIVQRGGSYVEPTLAAGLVRPVGPATTPAITALSRQERRVLQYVAEGHTNQAIAGAMNLSVKTVETYRSRLSEKLGLKTRAELFRFAVEAGLVTIGRASDEGPGGDPAVPGERSDHS